MCQPKNKGGKRCARHMNGSMATITMCSLVTGVNESFVGKVFTSLRKEGKNLPAPEREEVVALTESEKFRAKYDPSIPENRRKTLVNRWEKAQDESPDGGTMHAWRNTLPRTLMKAKRTLAATAIAGTLAFTSACGGSAGDSTPNPSVIPTNAPTSISQTETADPNAKPTPAPTQAKLPKDVTKKGTVDNGYGQYVQTSISDDAPAMQYDASITDPAVLQRYSPAEVKEAQQTAVKFMAEEGIDSIVNGAPENADKWWKTHKDDFSKDQQGTMYKALKNKEGSFLINETWMQEHFKGEYNYIYHPEQTRLLDREITPKGNVLSKTGNIGVWMDVSFDMRVTQGVSKETKSPGVQKTTGEFAYIMKQDTKGEWKIDGYVSKWNTETG